MDYKRFQIHFYQHSGKYFPVYSIILLVLIAGWISLLLLPVNSSIAFLTICIYVLVPLLIIVIFVGWITVWGWYHSWFRYLAYFWALLSRLVRKFLASWWVKFFLFLVAALLFQARWFLLLDREITWDKIIKDFVEFESLMMTVAITLAFMLIYQILKARKRLVISRFENHTGLKEMDSAVTSIGTRILNEMSRLHDLLVDIDEINPQERSGLIENTLMIQDIGKNLENLIGTQSRVEIGSFLKIPLDLFYAFVIRLMQGRMLRGSLHINGDKLILTARLRGGDFNKTWRVNSEDLDPPAPTSKTEMLAKMTEELVCRIFTVLANGAPPRWRAVKYYTQGLRMYRETVNTETKKKINLLQAKQAFIESLREYEFFGQCYYNLGIVYTDLDNKRAAETTFQEGLKIEPDNFDCYFKLALLYYYNHKEPKDTRWICGEARAIFPHHPYPWNLMGVSFFDEWGEEHPEFQAEHKGSSKNITCNRAPVIDKNIVISFRNASLFAWKGLCRSLKKGEERQNKKIVAAICLLNLAKALGRKKRTYCASIFSQSLFLAPHDNEIYYELGKFYYCREKIKKAFNAFIRVCQEDENVDSVQFWALYSHTCAQLYKAYKSKKETSRNRTAVGTYKEIIQNNYMHFLNAVADFIQDIQSKPWDTDSNAYRKLVKSEQVFQINQEIMAASLLSIDEKEKADSIYFLNQLKKIVANVSESGVTKSRIEDKLEVLKDEIGKYLYVDGEWMEAQIKVAGGRALIQNEEDPKLIKVGLGYLIDAFTKLNGKYD